ncbi:hypothetical protein ACFE04_013867 [Oxalis oulophora]
MDNSKNRQNDHLGVNKFGKNIRKSPLHQPNFANTTPNRQQPQPQVYNISKNDFRNMVQQLTGSPSQDPLPRPPQNPPKPQSQRLQRIRPPPLTPINNRPRHPAPVQAPAPGPGLLMAPPPASYNHNFARPPQFGPPSPLMPQPLTPGDQQTWGNVAESPISAYMRYLQTSMADPRGNQPQFQGNVPAQNPGPGLLPHPNMPALPSPRMNGPSPGPSMYNLPSPRMNGPPPGLPMYNFPSPRMNGPPPMYNLPSPRMNGPPALLPSPTSQFLLPSPTGYMNLPSPRSPYPLFSPGQFPPPYTPSFAFSPMGGQSGILGAGPQAPPSPGFLFPLSPPAFFPMSSPRWREQ